MFGGLFGGGSSAPQYDPQIAQLNQGMMGQWGNDIGGVRNLANTPVSGLSAAGQAGQSLADTAYRSQLDQANMQQASGLASGMAGLGRFGADSGSAERMQNQAMRQGLVGQQQMGMANMQNKANLAYQDLGQQQQNQFTALMGLPQLQQGMTMADYNAANNAAGQTNQYNLANMASQQAGDQATGNMLGGIGAAAGSMYGPLGSMAGGMIGKGLGGLFS